MQFQFEPFVTNNPVLLRVNNAGDWSSAPAFSAGNISVRTESFLGASQGLGNPATTTVGKAHPLAAFGLANQYSNMISLFSFTPPAGDKISDVTISPPPGIYQATVKLSFVAATPSHTINFRIGNGPWTVWTGASVVNLFSNATVQYYGQPVGGAPKSSIQSASYYFTQPPSTLDSKHDGIPDFVKVALGLNLTGSRDSDGDGYSDLEELIHGTNPLNSSSVPTNFPHLDDQAVFDLNVTPWPLDGFANSVTLPGTNVFLHAYDLQGAIQTSVMISNNWPAGILTNIPIVAEDRFVSVATDPNYPILTAQPDTNIGREMLELFPLPTPTFPSVPYTFGGGNLLTEAHNWIIAASNLYNHLPRAVLTNTMTIDHTLEALLFEQEVAPPPRRPQQRLVDQPHPLPLPHRRRRPRQPLRQRAPLPRKRHLPPSPATNCKPPPPSSATSSKTSASPAPPACAPSSRIFIELTARSTIPTPPPSPAPSMKSAGSSGAAPSIPTIWPTPPPPPNSPPPPTPPPPSSPPFRRAPPPTSSSPSAMTPCPAPAAFLTSSAVAPPSPSSIPTAPPSRSPIISNSSPGSVVLIAGYTDAANTGCAYPAIEVTAAVLSSVPLATDQDADGDLLIDTWEKRFFGSLGVNPFADPDGDGYSNLQEMLEGSDPRDHFGLPLVAVTHFGPPAPSRWCLSAARSSCASSGPPITSVVSLSACATAPPSAPPLSTSPSAIPSRSRATNSKSPSPPRAPSTTSTI